MIWVQRRSLCKRKRRYRTWSRSWSWEGRVNGSGTNRTERSTDSAANDREGVEKGKSMSLWLATWMC